jgi:hypothetical protein
MPHLKFNVDASKCLVDYVSQVFHLRRRTAILTVAARDSIIQSRALIAELDALLAMDVLRPVYSSPAASVVSLGELPTP